MAVPEFYATSLEQIDTALSKLKRGSVKEIGRSAGDRPIYAVAYGEFEPIARTADLSSALAARDPAAFFGAEPRKRQVMLITSAIHGGEMESIAAALNLISVMETATDLKGEAWPDLAAASGELRVVIVPCLNPDGRARIPSDDPTRWTNEEEEKYRHGLNADGSLIGWPACMARHPRDPKQDAPLGGYFNDAGVNPLHGVFLPPRIAPETHAGLALAEAETPDLLLDLHSCGAGPMLMVGDPSLPEELQRHHHYLDGFCRRALRARPGIHRPWAAPGIERVLTFATACHHLCGALPMLFEGANGAQEGNRYAHHRIVDMYLVVFEALMSVGATEGFLS